MGELEIWGQWRMVKRTTFKKREKREIMARTQVDALTMNSHDFVI